MRSHVVLGPGAALSVKTIEINRKHSEGHLVLACGPRPDDSRSPAACLKCREASRNHEDFHMLLEIIYRKA